MRALAVEDDPRILRDFEAALGAAAFGSRPAATARRPGSSAIPRTTT